jgi:ABC-type lipoprotein release transport system permease subunit
MTLIAFSCKLTIQLNEWRTTYEFILSTIRTHNIIMFVLLLVVVPFPNGEL